MNKDFIKHRNMLNEEEYLNVQMYDSLQDKLTDEQFISQAVENNKKTEINNATLLQVKGKETGPYDRNNNPFEQFRKMGGGSDSEESKSSGPYDRYNNPFE